MSVLQVPGLKLDRDQITHHYLPRIEVWHDQTVFTILDTWRSVSVVIDCWPSDSQKVFTQLALFPAITTLIFGQFLSSIKAKTH